VAAHTFNFSSQEAEHTRFQNSQSYIVRPYVKIIIITTTTIIIIAGLYFSKPTLIMVLKCFNLHYSPPTKGQRGRWHGPV